VLQNNAFRNITRAFKKTNTEILETEASIPPIYLVLNRLQDQATVRMRSSGITAMIQRLCTRIKIILETRGGRRSALTHKRPEEVKAIAANKTLAKDIHIANRKRTRRGRMGDIPPTDTLIIKAYYMDQWKKR